MKRVNGGLITGMAIVALAGLLVAGCESTKTSDNVIVITPGSVALTNDWSTVVFTAALSSASTNTALALPLVWSVSDSARGTIRASGGLTAIYETRNLSGNNTVTVHDQADNEGIAVVIR